MERRRVLEGLFDAWSIWGKIVLISIIILTIRGEIGSDFKTNKLINPLLNRHEVSAMVSRTQVTKTRRANKRKKAGKKRKHDNINKGTTPKFDIHPEKKSK